MPVILSEEGVVSKSGAAEGLDRIPPHAHKIFSSEVYQMAGTKGRSGGAREGAGRPAKEPIRAEEIGEVESPLDFLRKAMNDKSLPVDQRLKAAIELAKYENPKAGAAGKKQEQEKAAGNAAQGKFAPAAPPKLRVVNS